MHRPYPIHLLRWYKDPAHDYRDLDRFARSGGNISLDIMPHGGTEIVGKGDMYRDLGHRLRRLSARYGSHVRLLCGIKTYIVKPDSRYDWSEHGFDYGWVAQKDGTEWVADLMRFTGSGYAWALDEYTMGHVPHQEDGETVWDKCLKGRPFENRFPLCEVLIDRAAKIIRPHAMVLDLRINACREWLVEEWLRFQREIGMDTCEMGLKNNRYRHPAPPTLDPDDVDDTAWKGSIHATPYGPGEWEASIVALLRAYEAEKVWVVLNNTDRDPQPRDKWFWLKDDERDLPLGEYSGVR
jgi:hypothetical protein